LKSKLRWVPIGVLAAAVMSVAVGAAGGEPREVLGKAVRICLECIGIG